jgi:hypothetical protein
MGVPTTEVGYTSATSGRGDHEVHKRHVVALGREKNASAQNHRFQNDKGRTILKFESKPGKKALLIPVTSSFIAD